MTDDWTSRVGRGLPRKKWGLRVAWIQEPVTLTATCEPARVVRGEVVHILRPLTLPAAAEQTEETGKVRRLGAPGERN